MLMMINGGDVSGDDAFDGDGGHNDHGDDEDGNGNGEFSPAEDAENCDAWVSYIAALT